MITSCVPNRKILYLQKDDLYKKDIETNKMIREYAIDTFVYRIQPNDVLSVRFESLTPKSFDFLTNQATNQAGITSQANPLLIGELVDEQGMITLPALGQFKVAGLTVFELQELLRTVAGKFVDSPIVRVRLINYRVTILGEVNKEGTITLQNNRVSIVEALGLAGGLNDFAERSKVKLIRQTNGRAEVIYLNLQDENIINSPYYYLHQSDVLIVPPLKQRPFLKYFGQNLSLVLSILTIALLITNIK